MSGDLARLPAMKGWVDEHEAFVKEASKGNGACTVQRPAALRRAAPRCAVCCHSWLHCCCCVFAGCAIRCRALFCAPAAPPCRRLLRPTQRLSSSTLCFPSSSRYWWIVRLFVCECKLPNLATSAAGAAVTSTAPLLLLLLLQALCCCVGCCLAAAATAAAAAGRVELTWIPFLVVQLVGVRTPEQTLAYLQFFAASSSRLQATRLKNVYTLQARGVRW